jgi:rare lipoprotein A
MISSAYCSIRRVGVIFFMLWGMMADFSFSYQNCKLFTFHSSLLFAQIERGYASFYARNATGSRTANGERLHHDSLTCAHRTLPFNTYLKVTNQNNGKSVVVRVNDRGPYVKGRIIDLSHAAAQEIGMMAQGIVPVTVEQAYRITIPLKAPSISIPIPKMEITSIEIPDTLQAIWQEDMLIEHKKVSKKKKKKR